jgi:hypothetical protein
LGVHGLGTADSSAPACKFPPPDSVRPNSCFLSALSAPPVTVRGVGTEAQPLPDVGCARAVCSQYRRRNGVAFRFQVSTNKVEPAVSNRGSNLLSKDD